MAVYKETILLKSHGKTPTYVNITPQVREAIEKSGIQNGICTVISPHTTCSVCFEDIEITEDDFDAMAEKVMTTTEWEFRPKNAGVTKESFIECMKETDDFGKALKL